MQMELLVALAEDVVVLPLLPTLVELVIPLL
jgi:hypothetical protein